LSSEQYKEKSVKEARRGKAENKLKGFFPEKYSIKVEI
jgi:hypothetical protein